MTQTVDECLKVFRFFSSKKKYFVSFKETECFLHSFLSKTQLSI